MNKHIIYKFLTDKFFLRKIKNNKNKWVRVIMIPKGYISNQKILYDQKKLIDRESIKNDTTKIITNVFGCDEIVARKFVNQFFKSKFKF